MEKFLLSVNEFAEFTNATPLRKLRIVEAQKATRDRFFFWNQAVKWAIVMFFRKNKDLKMIKQRITLLSKRKGDTKRREDNRIASIQALKVFLELKLPDIFEGLEYEVLKVENKSVIIHGVELRVTPELIIRAKIDGKKVIGGIKFHLAKKTFKPSQSKLVAAILKRYLETEFKSVGDIVYPDLCFSLELHGAGLICAPSNSDQLIASAIPELELVKELWGNGEGYNLAS